MVQKGINEKYSLDIVGSVYHLVIWGYMQSNKIRKVILMIEFYSALMLARHVSDLIDHISRRVLQAVFADLVYGNARTTRHVQPLRLDVSSSTCVSCWTAYILKNVQFHRRLS